MSAPLTPPTSFSFGDILRLMIGPEELANRDDPTTDRVLDALDAAPIRRVVFADGGPDFHGPLRTIQEISAELEMSDSAVRNAVRALINRSLARGWVALDPISRRRRIYVTAAE